MSYRIFLDSFLLPIKVGEGAALEALNTVIKAERQKMKRVFTEAGQPGDMFRLALEIVVWRQKLLSGARTSQVGYHHPW